jgi:hypothetical protein
MANRSNNQSGSGQVIVLAVIAAVLAAGYVVLDLYSAGQKDMLMVETRGLQMISALTRFKQETGSYPDALEKLVPKHAAAVSKCPGGEAMAYRLTGSEFSLSCENVVFKRKPYRYDSRSRTWEG